MKISGRLRILFSLFLLVNDVIIVVVLMAFIYKGALPGSAGEILVPILGCICLNALELLLFHLYVEAYLTRPLRDISSRVMDRGNTASVKEKNELAALARCIGELCREKDDAFESIRDQTGLLAENQHMLSGNLEKANAAVAENNTLNNIIAGKMVYQNNFINQSAESSQEIDSRWDGLQELIGSQASAVRESTTAVMDMIRNVSGISETIQRIGGSADDLLSISKKGGETIYKSLEFIMSISGMSGKLDEIIAIITDIASRINLLSINASVEAAHAGQFGRGFAVVAKEIKRLAEQTAENANTIQKHLKESNETISSASEISKNAHDKFKDIFNRVTNIAQLIKEAQEAVRKQSDGGKGLHANLDGMVRMTTDIQGSSATMKATIEDLMTKMANLKNVAKETMGTSEILDGSLTNIRAAIDTAGAIADENGDHSVKILEEALRFAPKHPEAVA